MEINGTYYCSRCMRKMEEAATCPHCGWNPDMEAAMNGALCEGTFLNDRYIFGTVVGSGGFGITYAAWDINLQIPVAAVVGVGYGVYRLCKWIKE